MHPAFSVLVLTTLIGAGQGLLIAVYVAELLAADAPRSFFVAGALVAAGLTFGGLVASFFHLGRPERAWRTATKWRTSWLSREVLVLPAFLGGCVLYAAAHAVQATASLPIGAVTLALCIGLFVCTGMIYACVKFLQEWASPLTLVNFALLGCASGATLAAALAALWAPTLAPVYATAAIVLALCGWASRAVSLARNARLRPNSTLQSAIGVKHPHIVQKAQGFMGGSFNTREFFHGVTPQRVRAIRLGFQWLGFAIPIALLAIGMALGGAAWFALAFVAQYLGLLAERWYFFAEANHPQNLYYQAMS
jgi:DMSO reductase anchor subunit